MQFLRGDAELCPVGLGVTCSAFVSCQQRAFPPSAVEQNRHYADVNCILTQAVQSSVETECVIVHLKLLDKWGFFKLIHGFLLCTVAFALWLLCLKKAGP